MAERDWTQQFDGYCERTDFSFWSEPINADTNAAFVIAALWMWQRSAGIRMARLLCVILFMIGIGSFLFHTFATAWALLADVAPIGLFILTYLCLVNRDFVGLHWAWALLATSGFLPYAYVLVSVLNEIPFLQISNFYWTVPILLLIYAFGLRRKMPQVAKGMVWGALLLSVSITVRSIDEGLCAHWPTGTHFVWHLLNACMLGWMIEVYRRQQVEAR